VYEFLYLTCRHQFHKIFGILGKYTLPPDEVRYRFYYSYTLPHQEVRYICTLPPDDFTIIIPFCLPKKNYQIDVDSVPNQFHGKNLPFRIIIQSFSRKNQCLRLICFILLFEYILCGELAKNALPQQLGG